MPLKHPVQATVKHGEYHNVKFSAAEDDDLVQYLATYSGAALGRSSRDLYDVLGQHASDKFAWSRHRQAASWRSRYANNKKMFDKKIDSYKLREMETPRATGVTTHVVPSISKPKAPTVTAPTSSASSATEAKKRKRPTDEDISTTSQLSVTAAADTATVLHPPVKKIKVFPVSATKVPLPTHASDSGNVPRLDLSQMQRTPAPMTPAHFPFASGSTSHTSTPKLPAPLPASSGSTRTFDSGPQSTSTPYRPWENVSESSLLNAMATLSGKPITPELAAEAAAHVAALRANGSQLRVSGAKVSRSQAKSRSGSGAGSTAAASSSKAKASSSLLLKAKKQSRFHPVAVVHPAPVSPPPAPFSDDDVSLRFDSTPPPTPPPAPTEGQRRPLPLVVHVVKPRRRREEKLVPVKENNGGGPAVTPPPNLHPPMNNDGGLASTSTSKLNTPTNKPVLAATMTPTTNEPSSASTPIARAADAESVQKPSPTLHAALTELVAKSFFTVDRAWQAYIAAGRCVDASGGATNTKHASATRMERTTVLLEDMEMAALNVRWETLQVNRSLGAGADVEPKSGEGKQEEKEAKPKEKKKKRKRENAEDLKEGAGTSCEKKQKRKGGEDGGRAAAAAAVDTGSQKEKRKKKKDHDERSPPKLANAEPSTDDVGKRKRKWEEPEKLCDVVDATVDQGVDWAPPPPKKKKKSKEGKDAVGSGNTDGDSSSKEKKKKKKKDAMVMKDKSTKNGDTL
ncbi:hypothetical protein C8R43DRAFT_1007226 [Mycena crocata]|nr:hypothetical protein C8R43DRAFT_1007226 [Mycena crocata]